MWEKILATDGFLYLQELLLKSIGYSIEQKKNGWKLEQEHQERKKKNPSNQ